MIYCVDSSVSGTPRRGDTITITSITSSVLSESEYVTRLYPGGVVSIIKVVSRIYKNNKTYLESENN